MSDALVKARREHSHRYGISRKGSWKQSQKRSAKRKLDRETRKFLEAREAAKGHGPIARILGETDCDEDCCT